MLRALPLAEPLAPSSAAPPLDFATVYEAHFDFVWRSLRRMGVPDSAVDDALQDVFIVAHRRLNDFNGSSSVKTWLFGIAYRVAGRHRPSRRMESVDLETVIDWSRPSPHEVTADEEARRLLYQLLESLEPERRAVFILSELEGMSAPEIAEALAVKLNTVYSRLRLARQGFEAALRRYHAAEGRGRR